VAGLGHIEKAITLVIVAAFDADVAALIIAVLSDLE
jgi:hypothetical protein